MKDTGGGEKLDENESICLVVGVTRDMKEYVEKTKTRANLMGINLNMLYFIA